MSKTNKANYILKYMDQETHDYMTEYLKEVAKREYKSFQNEGELNEFFEEYMQKVYSSFSSSEIDNLRYYTGIAFNDINSLLRGMWSYERSGALTEERKNEIYDTIKKMDSAITKLPDSLPGNIKAYRGLTLASFRDFGIYSLEDLVNLKDQYYYEDGFTSTSLIRENSFFNRELDWHDECNIEIEYSIPEESSDGIPLINDELSYSNVQSEFLLNRGTLVKIKEVTIKDKNAYIKAILVPKKVWNKEYKNTPSKTK